MTAAWIFCIILFLINNSGTVYIKSTLYLTKNGTVTEKSEVPKCADGGRIDLLSYSFEAANCHSGNDCSTPLPHKAELALHEMCSFKHVCSLVRFPLELATDQKLNVRYECLDHFSTQIDMCLKTTKSVDDTFHLMTTKTIKDSQKCLCTITDGRFSVSLNDLRLISEDGNKCTSVELRVRFHDYICNSTKTKDSDYGSVFNTVIEKHSSATTIVLSNVAENLEPQMAWLTIKPQGSVKIRCNSNRFDKFTTETLTSSYSLSTYDGYKTDNTSTASSLTVVIVVPVIVFAVVVVLVVLIANKRSRSIICRKRKILRRSSTKSSKTFRTNTNDKLASDNQELSSLNKTKCHERPIGSENTLRFVEDHYEVQKQQETTNFLLTGRDIFDCP